MIQTKHCMQILQLINMLIIFLRNFIRKKLKYLKTSKLKTRKIKSLIEEKNPSS